MAPAEELYDLRADRAQQTPIDDAKELASWRAKLKDFASNSPASIQATVSADLRERLAELGAVGDPPAVTDAEHPADPKDKFRILEGYRAATALAASKQWAQAVDVLRGVMTNEGDVADVWNRIGVYEALLGRDSQAAAAFERVVAMEPANTRARLQAGGTWLRLHRLENARRHAEALTESTEQPASVQVEARVLLANIALARRDTVAARRQAALVSEFEANSAFPSYVEGRLSYDRGRYAEALKAFEAAAAPSSAFATDLHWYTGEALVHLGRHADAIPEFERAVGDRPLEMRARAALARAFERTGQRAEAVAALTEMTRALPTPESFAIAAEGAQRLGEREQAAALRAEARRRFAEPGKVLTQ